MTVARAGGRRSIVQVEQHDGTITNGEPTYSTAGDWDVLSSMTTVPVMYQGVSGGEVVRGMQMEATTTGLVRMLSTTRTRTIKPRMRLVMDSRNLYIMSIVDRDGDQRELWVQVKEQADA